MHLITFNISHPLAKCFYSSISFLIPDLLEDIMRALEKDWNGSKLWSNSCFFWARIELSTQIYCVENTISVLRKTLLCTRLGKVIDKVQNAADSPTVDKVDVTILLCLWKHSNYMSGNLYKMFFNSRLNLAAGCHVFCSSFSRLKISYNW